MSRYFFALWPTETLRKAIIKQREQLKCTGRPTADNNLHITLLFLGKLTINQLASIIEQAEQIHSPNFELAINQTGYFKNSQAFWIGPEFTPEPLQALHEQLLVAVSSCDIVIRTQSYKPHITLSKKSKTRTHEMISPLIWPVREFVLVKSIDTNTGVNYEIIKHFTFKIPPN